ncbi:MAG: CocE/NonD family hydrolase [Chthoniobacterales bacterium]
MRGPRLIFSICCLLAGLTNTIRAEPAKPALLPTADYEVLLGVKIPMRDAVELNATLYLPRNTGETGRPVPAPVVCTLTPYLSDGYHERGAYFASHGYVFALIDVRGRGNSEGYFEAYVHDAEDGFDTVEWLAAQPFCDGHVGMWGGSYAGFNQWATAKERPPHLSTIVPAAAAHPGVDVPHRSNVGQPYLVRWLTLISGRALQGNLFGDLAYWRRKYLEAYRQHVAFQDLDSFLGNPLPDFQRFVQHPTRGSFYDRVTPSVSEYGNFSIPILTITGQYDDDEYGALAYYRDHLASAAAAARAKHYLVIGPWDHPGTRTPTAELGGVKFGSGALLDLNDLHRQWYDWTMRKGSRPAFLKQQVTYYQLAPGNTGANGEWRYADTLASLPARSQKFYLDSENSGAHGVFHSGELTATLPREGFDRFTYDPLDTHRGEQVEAKAWDSPTELLDQRYALSIGEDGLVYHSAPLKKATDLIGCPSLHLWLSVDTPDTDLEAYLYEIQPDGTSIRLWADVRRLRYRESLREGKLVKPGEIVECSFAPGLFVARTLMEGSRLRLVVSSPNSFFTEKNYNSGGVIAEETAKDARTAHVQVYHDTAHPSALELSLHE